MKTVAEIHLIRYRICFKAKSCFDHCLSTVSFAINSAASIPWDQANFIGCHKVIWRITKRLIDRPIGFRIAKHSRVYEWHTLKFSLKRAKILNFTYSEVQTMFKSEDFVWWCSFTYVLITCHRHVTDMSPTQSSKTSWAIFAIRSCFHFVLLKLCYVWRAVIKQVDVKKPMKISLTQGLVSWENVWTWRGFHEHYS